MNENLLKKAEELADRDYSISFSFERTNAGTTLYMAKTPELKGCMAQGETLEEAIKNLRDARIDYIYDSLENNSPIPDPALQQTNVQQSETADTSIHFDVAKLTIKNFIPINVPSEPIVPRIRQSSEA